MSDSLPVRWWTPQAGFGASAHWDLDGPLVVGIAGQTQREAARLSIRAAVRAALALACGVAEAAVALHAEPAQVPFALVDIAGTARHAWLGITHDGALSLAAFRFDGPVGIDLMQIVSVPDWQAVARDYLGPTILAALSALPDPERDAAFARAWSEREARLKCLGLDLREWQIEDEAALQACTCLPVAVPDQYAALLAFA